MIGTMRLLLLFVILFVSAVYEAIPGFASLLALNPHALDRAGLYPLSRFNFNPNHHRLVLQLIMALRDLPK